MTEERHVTRLHRPAVCGRLGALALVLAASTWAGCRDAGSETGSDTPDIILITLDTLRTERLGCYGYHRSITPHLDAFAAESTRFTRRR